VKKLLMTAITVCMAGCAHEGDRTPLPHIPVASAYKETLQAQGYFQQAEALRPDDWWKRFQDPELDALQTQLLANSADLASALARYQQVQAVTDSIRAAQSPTVDAQLNLQRNRQSANRPLRGADSPDEYNSGTLGLNLSYELDVWGRVRQLVTAGEAGQQAALADLAAAQLNLQARLADTLFALRGADQEVALLRETESAYRRSVSMIEQRHAAGLASGLDLARSQAQLQSTRALIPQVVAQRALYEHAIAALVGASASTFTVKPVLNTAALPDIPVALPSTLLQRRPDISGAQRRVTAANASVGVARTAFYPSVTLSAVGGYQSSELDRIINAPNIFWSIGPAMLVNLLDGGRRKAEVARAQALLDESGQKYRSVVLGAFQDVEDQLALLNHYADAVAADRLAVEASQRALELANNRYAEGAVSYLDVTVAQTASLQARRTALDLQTRQRRAAVALVRALGGGWSQQQLAAQ
jgi:NodT family efflux transporter outer membrane factor (OMF) lipoprotein